MDTEGYYPHFFLLLFLCYFQRKIGCLYCMYRGVGCCGNFHIIRIAFKRMVFYCLVCGCSPLSYLLFPLWYQYHQRIVLKLHGEKRGALKRKYLLGPSSHHAMVASNCGSCTSRTLFPNHLNEI